MTIVPQLHAIVKRIKKLKPQNKTLKRVGKSVFWFTLGGFLGLFFFISFVYIFYQNAHTDKVYDGVIVNGIDFGGKTKEEVKNYFLTKNSKIAGSTFTLTSPQMVATISAKELDFGYDAELLATQAMSIGRSEDMLSNMSIILQAYLQNVQLPPSYTYSEANLKTAFTPLKEKIDIKPVDPLFNFENNRVVSFRLGSDGKAVDEGTLAEVILAQSRSALLSEKPQSVSIAVPTRRVPSAVAEDKASDLGIKEVVGEGTSRFIGSIENRIFNISLAATRLNGTIIKPGEVFSFNKAVGDISVFNGYRQAMVISGGKTVLGDGGGVCQVSTTLFRAALNAGLPIVERNPHAYRVSYYESETGPGIDAAIYTPSVDLKFKNDTPKHLLIQTYVDLETQRLTFALYGTTDDRKVSVSKPVIVSEAPAPEPSYQDDPNLPKGEVKQIESAASGANVYFTRSVTRDGETKTDKFSSNYRPWQAVYMRGTKE
jgi:vancomycin resistance protein YoaR